MRFVLFIENGCFSLFVYVCRILIIFGCNFYEINFVEIDVMIKIFFVFIMVCYKFLIFVILKGKWFLILKEY